MKKNPQETWRGTALLASFAAAATGSATLYLTAMQGGAPAPKPRPAGAPEAFRDRAAPESCAALSDFRSVAKEIPPVQLDLAVLSNLPLTGKPVFDRDTAPQNAVKACLFPVLPGTKGGSEYVNRQIRHGRTNGASAFSHEAFHANQDIQLGGYNRIEQNLTVRDAATAELLKEATAVAYQISIAKEATLAGVTLPPHSPDVTFAADNTATQALFDAAYDAMQTSLAVKNPGAQNPEMDDATREAKAIEAGGQAVVRGLMSDTDTGWQSFYQMQAIRNVNSYLGGSLVEDGREARPDYAATRDSIFAGLGHVSDTINLTPPEFLGRGAAAAVTASLTALGVQADAPKAAVAVTQAPNPRRPA